MNGSPPPPCACWPAGSRSTICARCSFPILPWWELGLLVWRLRSTIWQTPLRSFGWLGMAFGVAALLFLFSFVYGRLRGVSVMGFGDIKLVAASALLVGPWGLGLQILIASLSALIFVLIRSIRRGRRPRFAAALPFGTFLGARCRHCLGMVRPGCLRCRQRRSRDAEERGRGFAAAPS